MSLDIHYLDRAFELAERGVGWTSPNPLVGAVLVKDAHVIGEGYHARYGEDHAEVAALKDARARGNNTQGATLYVTLEPCNHYGKVPPCTRAIIQAGITRVVYAAHDPNPDVAGHGADELRKAGLHVEGGVAEERAHEQNKIFFHWVATHEPYVCVKVAVSTDNKITKTIGATTRVSGSGAARFTHALRQRYDAIMVGAGTVKIDNPALTARVADSVFPPHQPLRVIIDSRLEVSPDARVFKDSRCLVVTTRNAPAEKLQALQEKVEVAVVADTAGRVSVATILKELARRGITSLLVEGGQQILTMFFNEGPVHEWILIRSAQVFGTGLDFIKNPAEFSKKFALSQSVPAGTDTIEYNHPIIF